MGHVGQLGRALGGERVDLLGESVKPREQHPGEVHLLAVRVRLQEREVPAPVVVARPLGRHQAAPPDAVVVQGPPLAQLLMHPRPPHFLGPDPSPVREEPLGDGLQPPRPQDGEGRLPQCEPQLLDLSHPLRLRGRARPCQAHEVSRDEADLPAFHVGLCDASEEGRGDEATGAEVVGEGAVHIRGEVGQEI